MRYNEQDVQEILRRAAAIEAAQGDITRENLVKTASELGISPDAVLRAEEDYRAGMADEQEFKEFKRHQRDSFRDHLVWYVSINLVLLGMNWWFAEGRITWAIWPLAGWGVAVFFHAVSAFLQSSQGSGEEFAEWKKERNKERKRLRRQLEKSMAQSTKTAATSDDEDIQARLS